MSTYQQAADSTLPVRLGIVTLAIAMTFFGCSSHVDLTTPTASTNPSQAPKIFLAIQPPTDLGNVKPGETLTILCKVVSPPGSFQPLTANYQVSDPSFKINGKRIGKVGLAGSVVSESEHIDDNYTFSYEMKAPEKPGRYVIEAKVHGVDPSRQRIGPPPAPAANGTPIKPGAEAEFDAPTLELKVKEG